MKILFSSPKQLEKANNKLDKREIIALMNLLNKLSESIEYYQQFLDMEKTNKMYAQLRKYGFGYFGVVVIFGVGKFLEWFS